MVSKILSSISEKTEEHEFYTPFPDNYKIGKTKYVITFGTVMSGLGKGIFSASLAKLLQMRGLIVAPIKFDGYLNVDAGTLNPYRHGEVFVLDDGTECDMDLGTYERFLELNLSKDNYLTGGKIFNSVLGRERKGEYLGRDVQFIPHVTGEIKLFLRNLAVKRNADIVFVEVGGTVGDIENMYFIEAMRELAYEEGKKNVCFISLTYILEPGFLGEQKSKAAQLGLKSLMSVGIQPDIIACRAKNPVTNKVREKISVYSNVPINHVVSVHDCDSIYLIPKLLKEAKVDDAVVDVLNVKDRIKKDLKKEKEWEIYVEKITKIKKEVAIGITGKYTSVRDSYASIINSLEHAGNYLGVKIKPKWIDTTDLEKDQAKLKEAIKDVSGILVPGGFGKRGTEGKIACIKYSRENNIPYLGLCFGFQMAVIEFARNVCNITDANSAEIAKTKNNVIDIMEEQKNIKLLGGNMRLGSFPALLKKNSVVQKLYGKEKITERHRHRYEVNNKYINLLEEKGLIFSGKSPDGKLMEFLELPNHKFFVGTQAHPCFKSSPLNPSPLFLGFVKAVLG